jgi:hypothetical protein
VWNTSEKKDFREGERVHRKKKNMSEEELRVAAPTSAIRRII